MSVSLGALCALICGSLLQIQDCTGQSLLGSPRPLVASVGDDVVLPCFFRPPKDVSDLTLEWSRPDLKHKEILVWQSFRELEQLKNPQFVGRAFLFKEELKKGNVSLRLTHVNFKDSGSYRCHVPLEGDETSVELIIMVPGSPALVSVSAVHRWSSKVELQCVSEAWYPQPELQWLDSEGRLLSAEHTLPLPAPDGLYSISSRLTVEHSGSFTCRLSHRSTNTTSQDTVRLTDDAFGAGFSVLPVVSVLAVALVLSVGFAITLFILYYRSKITNPQSHENPLEDLDQTRGSEAKSRSNLKSLTHRFKWQKDSSTAANARPQEESTVSNSNLEYYIRATSRLEKENENFKKELDSSKKTIPRLEEEKKNVQSDLDSANTTILKLKEDVKLLKAELDSSKTTTTRLEEEILKAEQIHKTSCRKELSESNSVIIDHFDHWGRSFSLINISKESQDLENWTVEIEIDKDPPLIFKFETSSTLSSKRGQDTVTVWAAGFRPGYDDVSLHLEWDTQPLWNTGKTAVVSLYNHKRELVDRTREWMYPD